MSGNCDSQLLPVRFVRTERHPIYHVPTAVASREKDFEWSVHYHTQCRGTGKKCTVRTPGWHVQEGKHGQRRGAGCVRRMKNGGRVDMGQMSLGGSREERGLRSCCQCYTVAPWILESTAHQDWLSREVLPFPDPV